VPAYETDLILEEIARSGADLVWVGMGTPSQDVWMASVAARAHAPMVGCGSVFDLLAGKTRPTPEWMKRTGLQWAFRLAQEPRRLAYRYANYNTRFVLAFSAQWLRHALSRAPRHGPPG
jgi:N-acetylglucosaminyldiphosphoundecaprenol N-acetyl-beta-D-mannosaminyltransferase